MHDALALYYLILMHMLYVQRVRRRSTCSFKTSLTYAALRRINPLERAARDLITIAKYENISREENMRRNRGFVAEKSYRPSDNRIRPSEDDYARMKRDHVNAIQYDRVPTTT